MQEVDTRARREVTDRGGLGIAPENRTIDFPARHTVNDRETGTENVVYTEIGCGGADVEMRCTAGENHDVTGLLMRGDQLPRLMVETAGNHPDKEVAAELFEIGRHATPPGAISPPRGTGLGSIGRGAPYPDRRDRPLEGFRTSAIHCVTESNGSGSAHQRILEIKECGRRRPLWTVSNPMESFYEVHIPTFDEQS
nr:hypothetical protein [Nocardia pneumoniae]